MRKLLLDIHAKSKKELLQQAQFTTKPTLPQFTNAPSTAGPRSAIGRTPDS